MLVFTGKNHVTIHETTVLLFVGANLSIKHITRMCTGERKRSRRDKQTLRENV